NNNNPDIIYFNSRDNPNLRCIFVDDAEYSEDAPNWYKDTASTYVETEAECDAINIDEASFQEIEIFPNPVKNRLYIKMPDGYDEVEISIYDVRGNSIISYLSQDTQAQIDISHLESGVYFLIVKNKLNKVVLTKKLIKL